MHKKAVAIFLTLTVLLPFAGCGGGGGGGASLPPAEDIALRAVAAMSSIKTYQLDMDMSINIAGESEGEAFDLTMAMGFTGAIDLENREMRADMTMDMTMYGETTAMSTEMYLIDGMLYMKTEDPDYGPVWEKSEMTAEYWNEVNQYINQIEPQLELLEAVQVEVIGSEKVGDVDCYMLKLTPDMAQLWQLAMQQTGMTGEEMLPDIDEEFLQDMFKDFSIKQWIAKDSYLLARADMAIAMELTPEALDYPEEEGLMTMDIAMDLLVYNYNQPVSIVLPPEAEEATEVIIE